MTIQEIKRLIAGSAENEARIRSHAHTERERRTCTILRSLLVWPVFSVGGCYRPNKNRKKSQKNDRKNIHGGE